jgi:ribosomal protein L19
MKGPSLRKGSLNTEMFTVRKVHGVGVERIFLSIHQS